MDTNSIRIAVRVRPWDKEKELPYIPQKAPEPVFLGDGNFSYSPRKIGSTTGGSLREVVECIDNRQLEFDRPEQGSEQKRGQPGAKRYKDRRYVFDHVFNMLASQAQVYEATAKPMLDGVLQGYNATIFAYGATGCGKTHTISGTPDDCGIIIRTMKDLFDLIAESADQFDTYIEVSFVEIYNENIRDLLSPDFPKGPVGGLKLLENEKERVTIHDVTLERPKSVDEVMALVMLGNERRSTSFTESNKVSSRSHAVLQINVGRNSRGHEVDTARGIVRQCTSSAILSIIDLAGSERAAATRNMGERMKEGANINKSLLALSNCISALCLRPTPGVKPHIPYRDSKLTRMLKFSLGGNCRTVMIVCVSPSSKDIEDTHNTLVWADRAKAVSTKVSKNTAGNRVSTAGYLQAIADKENRIQELLSKVDALTAQSTGHLSRKHEQALEAVARTLADVRDEKAGALLEIEEGARTRAQWDAAILKIASLDRRLQAISSGSVAGSTVELEQERTYLSTMIRKLEQAFNENPTVEAAARREAARVKSLENLLVDIDERRLRDKLEGHVADYMTASAGMERALISNTVLESRIKGYRQTLSDEAEARSQQAAMFCRFASSIQAETELLADLTTNGNVGATEISTLLRRMQGMSNLIQSALNPSTLIPSLVPLPPPPQVASTPARGSASSRQHVAHVPEISFNLPVSALRHSAARRVITSKGLGSPSRSAYVASPRKQPQRPNFFAKLNQKEMKKSDASVEVKKPGIQWRDEAGEGELAEYKDASHTRDSIGSKSPSTPGDGATSGSGSEQEWEEVESEEGSPSSALPFPLVPSVPTVTAVSNAIAPPVPYWKQHRILMGKSSTLLGSVQETAENLSPDQSKKLGLMGPPTRMPHQNSNLASSISQSSSSTLFRPTASSANRTVSGPFSLPSGPGLELKSALHKSPRASMGIVRPALSADSTSARRISNIGPQRTTKSHKAGHRPSLQSSSRPSLPGPASTTSHASVGNTFALGGGAKRVSRDSVLPSANNRRASVMGNPSVSAINPYGPRPRAGPRASVLPNAGDVGTSGFGLPRASLLPSSSVGGLGSGGLASKPSIGRLSVAAGAGAPWR